MADRITTAIGYAVIFLIVGTAILLAVAASVIAIRSGYWPIPAFAWALVISGAVYGWFSEGRR